MTHASSLGFSNMEELPLMGPSQLSQTSVFRRRDVKETLDIEMSRRCLSLMSRGYLQIPLWHSRWERAITLMKRMCHLSQSYYTLRKQTVSIISLQNKKIRHVCYFKARECVHVMKKKRQRHTERFGTRTIKLECPPKQIIWVGMCVLWSARPIVKLL